MSHISEVQWSHSKSVESEQTSSFLGFSSIDSSNNNSDLPDNTSQSHCESTNNLDLLVINFHSIRKKVLNYITLYPVVGQTLSCGTETHTDSGDYD